MPLKIATFCGFHVDYYKPEGKPIKPGETLAKRAVVDAILAKHDVATGHRKFNAIFATASINDAIEYYGIFKQVQTERQLTNPDFRAAEYRHRVFATSGR